MMILNPLARPNLNEDMLLPSLEQESSLLTSLSQDLVPRICSPKDVTVDIPVSCDPPAPFNHSCEFEAAEGLENPSKLHMSITSDI